MVSQRGNKENLDKIQAILNMEPKVQSLTRREAKATNKCLPFFSVLRKAIEWTNECQQAFEDLRTYLTTTPLLNPSKLGEELYLYLAVSPHVVSLALAREEGKAQKPVYYTNKALRGTEDNIHQKKSYPFNW